MRRLINFFLDSSTITTLAIFAAGSSLSAMVMNHRIETSASNGVAQGIRMAQAYARLPRYSCSQEYRQELSDMHAIYNINKQGDTK